MPFLKIYIHIVFSTKLRRPILLAEKRPFFFQHIRDHAKQKGILIDTIGGHVDHMHILIQPGPTQALGTIMKLIKGESAWWANRERLFEEPLIWERTYYAISVDPDAIARLRSYILNQEVHHQKISFEKECAGYL